jgi:vacuolar-type H+-ATPase subunit H
VEGTQRPERQPAEAGEQPSERIQTIIEAAEKAAAGIIEDAEAQARRYLVDSRRRAERIAEEGARAISDATDDLLERAEVLKRHSDDLLRALDEAKLEHDPTAPAPPVQTPDPPPDPARSQRPAHLKPVEAPPPEEQSQPEPEPPQERPPQGPYAERRRSGGDIPTAGARLLATQMAVAGSSRGEIERRLRSDFGIEDAEGMLDGILGPES